MQLAVRIADAPPKHGLGFQGDVKGERDDSV
jgi:hypothetical protein